DRQRQHRYYAACAAVLAAAGKGEDAVNLEDKERARLRQQAFDWLRADLTAWTRVVEQGPATALPVVERSLRHWQQNPDLAGLRDVLAVAKLPAAERDGWMNLWADVEVLLKRLKPPEEGGRRIPPGGR